MAGRINNDRRGCDLYRPTRAFEFQGFSIAGGGAVTDNGEPTVVLHTRALVSFEELDALTRLGAVMARGEAYAVLEDTRLMCYGQVVPAGTIILPEGASPASLMIPIANGQRALREALWRGDLIPVAVGASSRPALVAG